MAKHWAATAAASGPPVSAGMQTGRRLGHRQVRTETSLMQGSAAANAAAGEHAQHSCCRAAWQRTTGTLQQACGQLHGEGSRQHAGRSNKQRRTALLLLWRAACIHTGRKQPTQCNHHLPCAAAGALWTCQNMHACSLMQGARTGPRTRQPHTHTCKVTQRCCCCCCCRLRMQPQGRNTHASTTPQPAGQVRTDSAAADTGMM
jgi:hypothetical protein